MQVRDKYTFPPDLYYTQTTHLWLRHDEDKTTLGLDCLALETFGDIAYIAIQPVGTTVERGKPMGSVEAAKIVDDLISPISGIIVAVNQDALGAPETINGDGYGAGWLLKIEPTNWDADSAELVHGDALSAWAESEVERLGE